jgi:site-specific recombinase XerD
LSLAAGRSLVEVRNAMGHSDVSTTSIYLYLVEREGVKDIFA